MWVMPYVFSISQPQNGVEETDCGVNDSQQNSIMYQLGAQRRSQAQPDNDEEEREGWQ